MYDKTPRKRGRPLARENARLARQNPLCVHCHRDGRITIAAEWDHIVPLFKGGADHASNKQGLCKACHAKKTAADMGYVLTGCDASGLPIDPSHHWHSEQAKAPKLLRE